MDIQCRKKYRKKPIQNDVYNAVHLRNYVGISMGGMNDYILNLTKDINMMKGNANTTGL